MRGRAKDLTPAMHHRGAPAREPRLHTDTKQDLALTGQGVGAQRSRIELNTARRPGSAPAANDVPPSGPPSAWAAKPTGSAGSRAPLRSLGGSGTTRLDGQTSLTIGYVASARTGSGGGAGGRLAASPDRATPVHTCSARARSAALPAAERALAGVTRSAAGSGDVRSPVRSARAAPAAPAAAPCLDEPELNPQSEMELALWRASSSVQPPTAADGAVRGWRQRATAAATAAGTAAGVRPSQPASRLTQRHVPSAGARVSTGAHVSNSAAVDVQAASTRAATAARASTGSPLHLPGGAGRLGARPTGAPVAWREEHTAFGPASAAGSAIIAAAEGQASHAMGLARDVLCLRGSAEGGSESECEAEFRSWLARRQRMVQAGMPVGSPPMGVAHAPPQNRPEPVARFGHVGARTSVSAAHGGLAKAMWAEVRVAADDQAWLDAPPSPAAYSPATLCYQPAPASPQSWGAASAAANVPVIRHGGAAAERSDSLARPVQRLGGGRLDGPNTGGSGPAGIADGVAALEEVSLSPPRVSPRYREGSVSPGYRDGSAACWSPESSSHWVSSPPRTPTPPSVACSLASSLASYGTGATAATAYRPIAAAGGGEPPQPPPGAPLHSSPLKPPESARTPPPRAPHVDPEPPTALAGGESAGGSAGSRFGSSSGNHHPTLSLAQPMAGHTSAPAAPGSPPVNCLSPPTSSESAPGDVLRPRPPLSSLVNRFRTAAPTPPGSSERAAVLSPNDHTEPASSSEPATPSAVDPSDAATPPGGATPPAAATSPAAAPSPAAATTHATGGGCEHGGVLEDWRSPRSNCERGENSGPPPLALAAHPPTAPPAQARHPVAAHLPAPMVALRRSALTASDPDGALVLDSLEARTLEALRRRWLGETGEPDRDAAGPHALAAPAVSVPERTIQDDNVDTYGVSEAELAQLSRCLPAATAPWSCSSAAAAPSGSRPACAASPPRDAAQRLLGGGCATEGPPPAALSPNGWLWNPTTLSTDATEAVRASQEALASRLRQIQMRLHAASVDLDVSFHSASQQQMDSLTDSPGGPDQPLRLWVAEHERVVSPEHASVRVGGATATPPPATPSSPCLEENATPRHSPRSAALLTPSSPRLEDNTTPGAHTSPQPTRSSPWLEDNTPPRRRPGPTLQPTPSSPWLEDNSSPTYQSQPGSRPVDLSEAMSPLSTWTWLQHNRSPGASQAAGASASRDLELGACVDETPCGSLAGASCFSPGSPDRPMAWTPRATAASASYPSGRLLRSPQSPCDGSPLPAGGSPSLPEGSASPARSSPSPLRRFVTTDSSPPCAIDASVFLAAAPTGHGRRSPPLAAPSDAVTPRPRASPSPPCCSALVPSPAHAHAPAQPVSTVRSSERGSASGNSISGHRLTSAMSSPPPPCRLDPRVDRAIASLVWSHIGGGSGPWIVPHIEPHSKPPGKPPPPEPPHTGRQGQTESARPPAESPAADDRDSSPPSNGSADVTAGLADTLDTMPSAAAVPFVAGPCGAETRTAAAPLAGGMAPCAPDWLGASLRWEEVLTDEEEDDETDAELRQLKERIAMCKAQLHHRHADTC